MFGTFTVTIHLTSRMSSLYSQINFQVVLLNYRRCEMYTLKYQNKHLSERSIPTSIATVGFINQILNLNIKHFEVMSHSDTC